MIIQRTLAEYLVSKISGLSAFKDELAFQESPQYPYMLTSLIGNKREALGAGTRDWKTETDETKVYLNEQSIRFTFRVVSTDDKNGNEFVSEYVRRTDQIIRQFAAGNGMTLTDSVTELPVRIAYVEYEGETDIQTITDKLPVVYQKSITYMFRIVDPSVLPIQSTPFNNLSISK